MSTTLEKEELLIRYLLGNASEAEQEEIETELFAENELFEQMIVVENDLIDSFIRGKLTAEEEELFKKQYFATETLSGRVAVSKAFVQVATESHRKAISNETAETEKHSWIAWLQQPLGGLAWARAGVAVLFIAASLLGGYLIWRYNNRENEVAQTPLSQPKPLASPTPALTTTNPTPSPSNEENKNTPEKRTPKQEQAKLIVATLILSGGAVRGGGSTPILPIKDNTSAINIKVKINDTAYASYQGIIKRVTGEEVWKGNLSRKGAMVEATISSQKFSQGDYIITVEGTTTEGVTELVKPRYFKVKISK